jgi:hypothetical protein
MCNVGDAHARLDFSRLRRNPSTTCATKNIKARMAF